MGLCRRGENISVGEFFHQPQRPECPKTKQNIPVKNSWRTIIEAKMRMTRRDFKGEYDEENRNWIIKVVSLDTQIGWSGKKIWRKQRKTMNENHC